MIDDRFTYTNMENDMVVRAMREGEWESYSRETWSTFIRSLPAGAKVWDVGSYTGYYALLSSHLRDDIDILAFEPHPVNYTTLLENIKVNGATNITPLQVALVSHNSPSKMLLNITNDIMLPSGSSLVDIGKEITRSVEVNCLVGDQVVSDQSQYPSLIKIDVEGAERYVLDGMVDILEKAKPILLIELLDDNSYEYAATLLESYGYKLFQINETLQRFDPPHDRSTVDRNYICVYDSQS